MVTEEVRKVNLLGVTINDFTINSLNKLIREIIKSNQKLFIGNHNLHSVYIYHKNKNFRALYKNASYIHIDGMPLVWVGKLLGHSLGEKNRITYIDWFPLLLKEAKDRDWKIFYLGSRPGVAQKGAQKIVEDYPGLDIKTRHGYFDTNSNSEENLEVVKRINEYNPNILLVGMGMPRQELWIKENITKINANVILNAGACMDYVAGEVATPPRWLGVVGLEWLFRFIKEPTRLARRYFIEPWSLVPLFLKDIYNIRLRSKKLGD